jgi:hypothetical protein
MLTVKFYNHHAEEGQGVTVSDVISCAAYSAYITNERVTISTYKDMLKKDGVERHVCLNPDIQHGEFQKCYVENSAGKTIEHFDFS